MCQAAALVEHKAALEEAVHARQLAEQDAQGAQALSNRYQVRRRNASCTSQKSGDLAPSDSPS